MNTPEQKETQTTINQLNTTPPPPPAAPEQNTPQEEIRLLKQALREEHDRQTALKAELAQAKERLKAAQADKHTAAEVLSSAEFGLAKLNAHLKKRAVEKPDYAPFDTWLLEARMRVDHAEGLLPIPPSSRHTKNKDAEREGATERLAAAQFAAEMAEGIAAHQAQQVKQLSVDLGQAYENQKRMAGRLEALGEKEPPEETPAPLTDLSLAELDAALEEADQQATALPPAHETEGEQEELAAALEDWGAALGDALADTQVPLIEDTPVPEQDPDVSLTNALEAWGLGDEDALAEEGAREEEAPAPADSTELEDALSAWGSQDSEALEILTAANSADDVDDEPAISSDLEDALSAWGDGEADSFTLDPAEDLQPSSDSAAEVQEEAAAPLEPQAPFDAPPETIEEAIDEDLLPVEPTPPLPLSERVEDEPEPPEEEASTPEAAPCFTPQEIDVPEVAAASTETPPETPAPAPHTPDQPLPEQAMPEAPAELVALAPPPPLRTAAAADSRESMRSRLAQWGAVDSLPLPADPAAKKAPLMAFTSSVSPQESEEDPSDSKETMKLMLRQFMGE